MTDTPDKSDEKVDDPFVELDIDDDGSDPFAELANDSAMDDAAPPTVSEQESPDSSDNVGGIEREDTSQLEDEGDPFAALGKADTGVSDDPFSELENAAAAGSANVFEDQRVEDFGTASGAAEEAPLAETAQEKTVIVPKSRYCQSCEFFDTPPNVQCMHAEAKILELVGMDRFKVRNCPIVERRTSAGMVSEGDVEYVDEADESQDQDQKID